MVPAETKVWLVGSTVPPYSVLSCSAVGGPAGDQHFAAIEHGHVCEILGAVIVAVSCVKIPSEGL